VATLQGKTLFITGSSRGIGKAIGLAAARDGANVVITGKSAAPNPRLPGTIHSAAEEIERAGGQALALVLDVREEAQIEAAVAEAVRRFGGLDVLVNNASAIFLAGTADTPAKRYDLMSDVNARGTFLCSRACLPHLARASNPHILNLSPPLDMRAKWFAPHVAYTMAKFGMSMCVLGMSEELRDQGIAVNALWPRTVIDTAATPAGRRSSPTRRGSSCCGTAGGRPATSSSTTRCSARRASPTSRATPRCRGTSSCPICSSIRSERKLEGPPGRCMDGSHTDPRGRP
jgi:citronellol/citronellal dehydrogenase